MPITDSIIVSVMTLAFVAFALGLAWGDYQSSGIARASRERALSAADARSGSVKQDAEVEAAHGPTAEHSKASAHI